MHIDPVARLAYWKVQEIDAAENVKVWQKRGDKMAPGAVTRAMQWHASVVGLVSGRQKSS